jgi:hypothetical protein
MEVLSNARVDYLELVAGFAKEMKLAALYASKFCDTNSDNLVK